MNAMQMHESLDSILREIKERHATEMQELKDQLMAAQIEATMAKSQLEAALVEKDRYMRIAQTLVTQFATVESVFSKAKEMAIQSGYVVEDSTEPTPPAEDKLPVVRYGSGEQDDTFHSEVLKAAEQPPPPAQSNTPSAAVPPRRTRAAA